MLTIGRPCPILCKGEYSLYRVWRLVQHTIHSQGYCVRKDWSESSFYCWSKRGQARQIEQRTFLGAGILTTSRISDKYSRHLDEFGDRDRHRLGQPKHFRLKHLLSLPWNDHLRTVITTSFAAYKLIKRSYETLHSACAHFSYNQKKKKKKTSSKSSLKQNTPTIRRVPETRTRTQKVSNGRSRQ